MRCASSPRSASATNCCAPGIENAESCFFNRFGQLIYKEPRGKAAGYQYPEVGIHRGKLHLALYRAVQERARPGQRRRPISCASASSRTRRGARLAFKETTAGQALPPVAADIVIACDGVNSALRKQLVGDGVVFTGINTWRGVTRHKPILDRPQLPAHRLDPHRQDRDLSDRRRRRRRGQPAHQLDHRDQARHGRR